MRRRRGCHRRRMRGPPPREGGRRSRCRRSPTAAGGVGGRGEKRTALPAAGVGEGASGGGGGGGWPTEPAKFPADSLRVGAAVEVRRRASSGADSGAAGGWRPGTVQSLVSAFNFRVRVRFDEPVRGAPRCVWLVCENDGEFPALRLDGGERAPRDATSSRRSPSGSRARRACLSCGPRRGERRMGWREKPRWR